MATAVSSRLRLAALAAILAAGALAWTLPIQPADGAADRQDTTPALVAFGPAVPVSVAGPPIAPAISAPSPTAAANEAKAVSGPRATARGGEQRWRQAERERRLTKPRLSRAERRRERARGQRFAFRPYINLNHAGRTP
jgi:hypothetical protein